jgi:hypothetical protein
MKWVLFTMLLCAVGPTQASAQNEISQQLLELDQDQRNVAFTHMLWDSNLGRGRLGGALPRPALVLN